jgi:hypothetical protein
VRRSGPVLPALDAFDLSTQRRNRASAAVAPRCRTVATDLDRVLDRLGQHDGIAQPFPASNRRHNACVIRGDGALGIGSDPLAHYVAAERRERYQCGQYRRTACRDAGTVVDLVGRDEQVGRAVRADDARTARWACDRTSPPRMLSAQAIRSGAVRTTRRHCSASQSAIAARYRRTEAPVNSSGWTCLWRARGWAVGPDRVDFQVGGDRDEIGAAIGERGAVASGFRCAATRRSRSGRRPARCWPSHAAGLVRGRPAWSQTSRAVDLLAHLWIV